MIRFGLPLSVAEIINWSDQYREAITAPSPGLALRLPWVRIRETNPNPNNGVASKLTRKIVDLAMTLTQPLWSWIWVFDYSQGSRGGNPGLEAATASR